MPSESSSQQGFSLLELLAVLVLLSLCAATTIRWYFSNPEVTLENAAILLARDLRSAQHRSIFLGEPGRFQFLPGGSGYAVTDAEGEIAHNPDTNEPFMRIYAEDGVFAGVSVVEAKAGADRVLEIDGRGNPTEDLRVTLIFGDEKRTLELSQGSGAIRINDSTSDWVDRSY